MVDRALDMIVINIHRNREQLVLGIGSNEPLKILGVGNLRIDSLNLLLRLYTLVQVGLSVVIQIKDLVLTLETRDLRFLRAEIPVQLSDTIIDEIRSLADDFLLLLDRILIVNGNHLIQDVRRTLRRCVMKREVDDAI